MQRRVRIVRMRKEKCTESVEERESLHIVEQEVEGRRFSSIRFGLGLLKLNKKNTHTIFEEVEKPEKRENRTAS